MLLVSICVNDLLNKYYYYVHIHSGVYVKASMVKHKHAEHQTNVSLLDSKIGQWLALCVQHPPPFASPT